jgi:hypothetical protein
VSHTAVAPEQLVLAVHWTHAPAVEQTGWFTSMPAHWEELVHAMHVPLLEQMGLVAGQVALVRHPTQVPLVEQKVRVGSLRAVHCAAVVQAAYKHHSVQMGALAGHVVLFKHWTHLLVLVSQSGVAPEQVEVSMHWTQAPVVAHAGWVVSRAAHWALAPQATHVPALEQIGVPAGQVALDRHCGAGRSGLLASKALSTAEAMSTNEWLSSTKAVSTPERLSSTKALSII